MPERQGSDLLANQVLVPLPQAWNLRFSSRFFMLKYVIHFRDAHETSKLL